MVSAPTGTTATGSADGSAHARSPVLTAVRALVVTGPFVLAFFSGGYFTTGRVAALVVAWLLVLVCAVAAPRPLPRTTPARLVPAALGAFALWVGLSAQWAPLAVPAHAEFQLVLLYVAVVLAACAVWTPAAAGRALEPLVASGILVVVLYGLSERVLPGLITLSRSFSAGGRLEQPLTYWNATGCLAAMGIVLCARLTADRTRPDALRAGAAAAAVPMLVALYVTYSRGALIALVAGLILLLVLAPTWSQLRACAIVVEAGVVGVLAAALSPWARALEGGGAISPDVQGALVLVAILVAGFTAAVLTLWSARAERDERTRLGRLPLPRWASVAAFAMIAALVVVPVGLARSSHNTDGPVFGASSQRFSSVGSNRYRYWKVAVRTFADHPVAGVGAGGWVVQWLKHRDIDESVRQPHSLWLQTLAEEGLIGFLLLLTAVGGVVWCSRIAHQADPGLVSGVIAAMGTWAVHTTLDWDWEMPAVTAVTMVLAGALIAQADRTQG